jgi:hypothetical protein
MPYLNEGERAMLARDILAYQAAEDAAMLAALQTGIIAATGTGLLIYSPELNEGEEQLLMRSEPMQCTVSN